MPLPKPIYPSYVPRSFITRDVAATTKLAMELYAKYHPSAVEQSLYQRILDDKTWQAKEAAVKAKALRVERDRILSALSRFRETGLGPSGRGGGAGGTGGSGMYSTRSGWRGSPSDVVQQRYAEGAQRHSVEFAKLGFDAAQKVDKLFEVHPVYDDWVSALLYRDLRRPKHAITADEVLEKAIKAGRIVFHELPQKLSEQAKRAGAAHMYSTLAREYPHLIGPMSKPSEAGKRLMRVLTNISGAKTDWLNDVLAAGSLPSKELERERLAWISGVSPGKEPVSVFEREAMRRLGNADADGDGIITEEERVAFELKKREIDDQRKELGLAKPLSVEEKMFLGRYIEALSDDGVATHDELQDDYDKAKAAYERGRIAGGIPRGAAPFYDQSYLKSLARLARVDEQLAAVEDMDPPQVGAARAVSSATGRGPLPEVPQEALEAAYAVSPIAAEVLPYSIRRIAEEPGESVSPRGAAEQFAHKYITTDANQRDFNSFIDAVNKKWNDAKKRRDAMSYYGAYYYKEDARAHSLNPGVVNADPTQALHDVDR